MLWVCRRCSLLQQCPPELGLHLPAGIPRGMALAAAGRILTSGGEGRRGKQEQEEGKLCSQAGPEPKSRVCSGNPVLEQQLVLVFKHRDKCFHLNSWFGVFSWSC